MNTMTGEAVPGRPLQVQRLPVEGMTCASCVGRVEKALRAVPGVSGASVNLATGMAEIHADRAIDPATLVAAVREAGYEVPLARSELIIEGMSCASCVRRVERALEAAPGVATASVNLASGRASVTGNADLQALIEAIAGAGYAARPAADAMADDSAARRKDEESALARAAILAALLTLPVFVLEMGAHLIPAFGAWLDVRLGREANWLLQFALTALVLAWPGLRFYRRGIPALLRAAPDMDSLVAVGTLAAFGYSLVATFAPGLLPEGTVAVYYEPAAVIVTLILVGRWLEGRARGRSSAAIQRLVGLQPRTARVHRDGAYVEIDIGGVLPGDRLEVRPGERVPVDGEVIEGSSWVDESMVTGEAVPVLKEPGAALVGGTVNQQGALTLRATAVGADTVLARIIQLVEEAQGAKLPIQALVDRITLWFVPAVMAVAVLTFLVWIAFGPAPALALALVNAVAVLIIACPCAMGLATPTSIMVATGRGAEMGVLFRRGDALQRLRDARVVAFDKTGTLTEGRPVLTDLEVAAGFEHTAVLAAVAAVEDRSEHPIARAIVEAARAEGLQVAEARDFRSDTGFGISGRVGGAVVAVGADRYMQRLGLDVAGFAASAERLGQEGKTPMYAAVDGRLAAILAVADPPREEAMQAIAALHAAGLKVAMITGDNRHTAAAVAARLGIDDVQAEVLPEGKLEAVRALRAAHGAVAFAGDGINDAPALAEADVGIALGSGTDVAMEAADVVLMSANLAGVPAAIALSQAAMRNIAQNLFWAFAYNVALIPVAAGVLFPAFGVLLSPALAAGAMAFSSVFVVVNALRLRHWQPPSGRSPA